MQYRILVLCFLGLFFACKRPVTNLAQEKIPLAPKKLIKQIELAMSDIQGIDIQEQLTGHDELLLTYQIGILERDSLVYSKMATVYLGNAKQGQKIQLDTLSRVAVELHPGQVLGVQVALWEVDDYQKTQKVLRRVNQVGGFLQIPIYMMEWSSVSNPLSWFLWGSRIGAWGLDWLAQVDHNDLLGVSEITWDWNDLPANMATRYKRGNWKGGKRGVNAYIYSFGYQIKVKDVSK